MGPRVEEDSGVDGPRLRLLARALGKVEPTGRWWPYDDPFEVAVSAVLTQRARWEGAAGAVAALRQAGLLTPRALAAAPWGDLERALRPAGFYRQKARALKAIASRLCDAYGARWELLLKLDTASLRRELLGWRGVGEETADAILLFAADRPAFVIDAYTRRLMGRFGALKRGARPSYRRLSQAWVEAGFGDAPKARRIHASIVDFSKSTCAARPKCGVCPLERKCMKVGVREPAPAKARWHTRPSLSPLSHANARRTPRRSRRKPRPFQGARAASASQTSRGAEEYL